MLAGGRGTSSRSHGVAPRRWTASHWFSHVRSAAIWPVLPTSSDEDWGLYLSTHSWHAAGSGGKGEVDGVIGVVSSWSVGGSESQCRLHDHKAAPSAAPPPTGWLPRAAPKPLPLAPAAAPLAAPPLWNPAPRIGAGPLLLATAAGAAAGGCDGCCVGGCDAGC